MAQQKINMIAQILKNPNSAFREISENPGHYLAFSVALFVISAVLSFYSSYVNHVAVIVEGAGYEWSAAVYAIESVRVVASGLLPFAVIFYVGKRLGGTPSFKRIFSVLSYCLIPVIIGTATASHGTGIFYGLLFVDSHHSGEYDGAAPSYALDFAFSQSSIFRLVVLPFAVWSVILAIKAVKIVNNFGTMKSFGIIILSGIAVYLLNAVWHFIAPLPTSM